jgi:SAM-dependent methyltransferase
VSAERRSFGKGFDGVADDYARERPTYPEELVDAACRGLEAGDRVLEIGCGPGKLTASLLARGLAVDALDPAPNMLRVAREVAPGARYLEGRFEDAALEAPYAAVFSAAAFHWVDPAVGWAKAADVLRPGGFIALIQHCPVAHADTAADDEALLGALRDVAPELADEFPPTRELATIETGVAERRDNISAVWTWLGGIDMTVPDPPFMDVGFTSVPVIRTFTADELGALMRTTSLAWRLGTQRADALDAANRRAIASLGGVARSSELVVLVTGRAGSRRAGL